MSPKIVLAQKNYYTPNTFIIPVHTQAKELHVSAGVAYSYRINTSYSITNHLALFASGTFADGPYRGMTILGSTFRSNKNNHSVSGGMGYLLNPTTTTGNVYELFIGAGKFKTDNFQYTSRYKKDITETYASYSSMFAQFNVVTKTEKTEAGAALRLAYNVYDDFIYSYTSEPYSYAYKDLWSLNAEPVFSFSYLIKKVKLNAQGGVSWPLASGNNSPYHIDPQTQEEIEDSGRKIGVGSLIGSINLQYSISLKK